MWVEIYVSTYIINFHYRLMATYRLIHLIVLGSGYIDDLIHFLCVGFII